MVKPSRLKRPQRRRKPLHCLLLVVAFGICCLWWELGLSVLQSPSFSTTARKQPTIQLVSTPEHTHLETDVRGNLGPASVLVQNGTDWLKDRWQAASDMHGTAIRGSHWVHLEFDAPVVVTGVVLDWETAYSNDYKLQGWRHGETSESATVLLDTQSQQDVQLYRSEHHEGQSPGVKEKLPLHVVHSWNLTTKSQSTALAVENLRLEIRKPFHPGWGVSLWKIDVFGYFYETGDE